MSGSAFARQREGIRAQLLSGTALQSEETGLRVGKAHWYLWVFHHKDSAVFVAEPTRAQTASSAREGLSDATLKSYNARLEKRLTQLLARTPTQEAAVKLSEWGAKLYADIRSAVETACSRGIDDLKAIRLTLADKPLAAPAPS